MQQKLAQIEQILEIKGYLAPRASITIYTDKTAARVSVFKGAIETETCITIEAETLDELWVRVVRDVPSI